MSEENNCYERCNQHYSPMQPDRLFCKKGCDSDEATVKDCKDVFCNKLCIKEQQDSPRLWFKFLYRAPTDSGPCLSACIQGCNHRENDQN